MRKEEDSLLGYVLADKGFHCFAVHVDTPSESRESREKSGSGKVDEEERLGWGWASRVNAVGDACFYFDSPT